MKVIHTITEMDTPASVRFEGFEHRLWAACKRIISHGSEEDIEKAIGIISEHCSGSSTRTSRNQVERLEEIAKILKEVRRQVFISRCLFGMVIACTGAWLMTQSTDKGRLELMSYFDGGKELTWFEKTKMHALISCTTGFVEDCYEACVETTLESFIRNLYSLSFVGSAAYYPVSYCLNAARKVTSFFKRHFTREESKDTVDQVVGLMLKMSDSSFIVELNGKQKRVPNFPYLITRMLAAGLVGSSVVHVKGMAIDLSDIKSHILDPNIKNHSFRMDKAVRYYYESLIGGHDKSFDISDIDSLRPNVEQFWYLVESMRNTGVFFAMDVHNMTRLARIKADPDKARRMLMMVTKTSHVIVKVEGDPDISFEPRLVLEAGSEGVKDDKLNRAFDVHLREGKHSLINDFSLNRKDVAFVRKYNGWLASNGYVSLSIKDTGFWHLYKAISGKKESAMDLKNRYVLTIRSKKVPALSNTGSEKGSNLVESLRKDIEGVLESVYHTNPLHIEGKSGSSKRRGNSNERESELKRSKRG